jgi:general secretion pathway protein L
MAIALENTIQQWRGRIRTGPAGRFVSWWIAELKASLPAGWQAKLEHARRRLALTVIQDEIVLALDEQKNIRELWRFTPGRGEPLQQQQLADLLIEHEVDEVPRFLMLDIDSVLSKELVLPAAAAPNLEQVLSFEMDRHTPFSVGDVYFAWQIKDQSRHDEQFTLQLYATPRTSVDAACEQLDDAGLAPSGVDVVMDGRSLGLNLLPVQKRARIINRKTRLNRYLALAAVVLLAITMSLSLSLRSHKVEALNEAIAAVRDDALAVQKIRDQIVDTSEAAGYLTQRRSQSPLAVEVLAEVTRALPDDTYLDRLVIAMTSVQMQGKSRNAQQLIEVVNDSSLLTSASFRGSTRLDARSGMEIFEVNAEIVGAIDSTQDSD